VWAYVIRRTPNRAAAEDITSEVFRKALEHLPRYEPRGAPFIAWLLRIAANLLVDRHHAMARESSDPLPDIVGLDVDLERRVMLFQLVERLPDRQRQVIELRFIEGRTLLEVAQTLETSEGAVKQLQHRALDSLRSAWEASRA
jgi:RNA polymerase sigma-70 factor (ECF subfamily)